MSQQSGGGSGASKLQLAALSAAATAFGLAAGVAVVYWKLQYDAWVERGRFLNHKSQLSPSTSYDRLPSKAREEYLGDDHSSGNSATNVVPLFDSVQVMPATAVPGVSPAAANSLGPALLCTDLGALFSCGWCRDGGRRQRILR